MPNKNTRGFEDNPTDQSTDRPQGQRRDVSPHDDTATQSKGKTGEEEGHSPRQTTVLSSKIAPLRADGGLDVTELEKGEHIEVRGYDDEWREAYVVAVSDERAGEYEYGGNSLAERYRSVNAVDRVVSVRFVETVDLNGVPKGFSTTEYGYPESRVRRPAATDGGHDHPPEAPAKGAAGQLEQLGVDERATEGQRTVARHLAVICRQLADSIALVRELEAETGVEIDSDDITQQDAAVGNSVAPDGGDRDD